VANDNSNCPGECKHIISGYLKCIKLNRGTNDEACRKLAKEYLTCRMDKYVESISRHNGCTLARVIMHEGSEMSINESCADPESLSRNLMAPDNFQNLGLVFKDDQPKSNDATTSTAQAQETGKKD
jgi:cytochrome c oxidase assembly protein subunit 19